MRDTAPYHLIDANCQDFAVRVLVELPGEIDPEGISSVLDGELYKGLQKMVQEIPATASDAWEAIGRWLKDLLATTGLTAAFHAVLQRLYVPLVKCALVKTGLICGCKVAACLGTANPYTGFIYWPAVALSSYPLPKMLARVSKKKKTVVHGERPDPPPDSTSYEKHDGSGESSSPDANLYKPASAVVGKSTKISEQIHEKYVQPATKVGTARSNPSSTKVKNSSGWARHLFSWAIPNPSKSLSRAK